MKATKMVEYAARDIGLYEAGQDLSAEDKADILVILNMMLKSWENDGIEMGYSDVELDDELYVPEEHELAVRFNLALMIAPQYEHAQVSPIIISEGPRLYRKVRDYYTKPGDMVLDRTLTHTTNRRRFNILND